jgi:uncharacterized protein YraI
MVKRIVSLKPLVISLVAVYILSSCSGAAPLAVPATAAPSPTSLNQGISSTEFPTDTPAGTSTIAPTLTDTTAPVATATEAATPTAAAATAISSSTAQVVPTLNPYCRKGPGTSYDAITFLTKGNPYNVIGRDGLNSWWLVQAPGNVKCWVGGANVNTRGPVEQVGIIQAPPLPGTPSNFVDSYECNTTLKTLGVSFNWAAANFVNGYRIYRDGARLVETGPDVTSYHDDAPFGESLLYELEAFNDYGVSERVSVTVPACK